MIHRIVRHLGEVPTSVWAEIVRRHIAWATAANRTAGKPAWDPAGLNVIGVRMNPVTDFYVRGHEDWNDHLVLVDTLRTLVHVFPCTVDPAKIRVNDRGVAHLNEGAWASYVRGAHKLPWRTALVQRTAQVRVTRTDFEGRVLCHEWGYFGINIHNAMGFMRPSAGCTVLKPERIGILDGALKRFRTILTAAPDRQVRTYFLMSSDQLMSYGITIQK